MNLRQQVIQIAKRHEHAHAFAGLEFPVLVQRLSEVAFFDRWDPGSLESEAVRAAMGLLRSPGFVTEDEPGVTVAVRRGGSLLDSYLEGIYVMEVEQESYHDLRGWWAVYDPDNGSRAFFKREEDAYHFRFDLINHLMNRMED